MRSQYALVVESMHVPLFIEVQSVDVIEALNKGSESSDVL